MWGKESETAWWKSKMVGEGAQLGLLQASLPSRSRWQLVNHGLVMLCLGVSI